MVQTIFATLLIFVVIVPFALQLVVWPLSDAVGLFAAQGAADRLRKHPDDAEVAQARGQEVARLFGGRLFVQDLEFDLRIVPNGPGRNRARVEASGRARGLLGFDLLPVRRTASGSVEGFRPDQGTEP